MTEHSLKTWPVPFRALWNGIKTSEFRNNDRGFIIEDTLWLQEWNPDAEKGNEYTGRAIRATITHITTGFDIPDGFAMLSIRIDFKGMEVRE